MTPTTARLPGLTAALLACGLVLTGCSGDADHDGMSGTPGSSSADSSSAGSAAEDPDAAAPFDDADVTFARGMLPHHQQAVEMARLAPDRAADPRVRDLAVRIEAAQAPEIGTLSGWLETWGAEPTGSRDMEHGSGHGTGHGSTDGMMSGQDMEALAGASGADFDRMFLELMLAHHRGAVQMAGTEITDGGNPEAIAMAEDIRDSQDAEIAEMQHLLSELGG